MSARNAAGGRYAGGRNRNAASDLYRLDKCQATRCSGTAVRWVPTVKVDRQGHRLLSGAPIPLDMGRDPSGPIVLDNVADGWAARPYAPGVDDPKRPRYAVHWSTCSRPELYAPVKAEADPAGILPGLTAPAIPSPRCGPCSRCGAEHDNHYGEPGPGDRPSSPLCDGCALEALARWAPADRRRYAELWPEPMRGRIRALSHNPPARVLTHD